ncbi:FAD assembly factor SdhE [Sedimenticola selenatireducens]|uniref:FAD assembly factor SdhE n=1 Tax=Sedimenticola selenatireducens TaxID=191960 RepID=A0A558DQ30_9GAMM|nr:succinate dehydrogenase assembly factor 2 [Sedimenticola selenatireducens]TVO70540.1 succinate dehydrogenase assembly factor 2 [Sedimenticola selenatireducens]TVT63117.1 MAG: succinate dehydrogenase assembly factor 2 [Sedimenticola selenatireducens]
MVESVLGSDLPPLGQLRWQCRRGMLELDYILIGFLDQHYPELPVEDKHLFVRMLDFEDQLLLDWVMGNVVPSDTNIRRLVGLMQKELKTT